MQNFSGVWTALVTPMTEQGVDYDALKNLVEAQVRGGVSGLVAVGTTGESPTLDPVEHIAVIKKVIEYAAGRIPVIAGTGSNCTREAVHLTREADEAGADGFLVVAPYYNKPNQNGLYAHFSAILEASPLPVILYNVPGRTGVNMTAETTLKLAHAFPGKAIAVKEASGNLSQAAYILRDRPKGFFVLSGEDNLSLAMIAMGGDGVISVSANVFPDTFCCMIHAALAGNTHEAAPLNLSLHEVTDLLFAEGNPVGAKAALSIKGIIKNNLRLPLVPASDALIAKIRYQIDKYGL